MFNVLDIVLKFINGVYRGVKYPIVISFYFILRFNVLKAEYFKY